MKSAVKTHIQAGRPRAGAVRRSVAPLRWREHHIKGNGWFGHTVTGAEIIYIYQLDRNLTNRPRWAIFQYWGANPDRCKNFGEISDPKTGKPKRYATIASAKAGAQRYWRREVAALLL